MITVSAGIVTTSVLSSVLVTILSLLNFNSQFSTPMYSQPAATSVAMVSVILGNTTNCPPIVQIS